MANGIVTRTSRPMEQQQEAGYVVRNTRKSSSGQISFHARPGWIDQIDRWPCEGCKAGSVLIERDDSLSCYPRWAAPTCIIVDGPYGLGKFPGEPKTPANLAEWYAPHVAAWSAHAKTDTTLWFWCTKSAGRWLPVLEMHGWQYEECNIWDKGIAHVAGNCNSKTIRGTPVVTEVAVRYTKRNQLPGSNGQMLSIKDWVRHEWLRSGLPMSKANDAYWCGECCDPQSI